MATQDVIADNLRTLRDLRGMSQLELAEEVGVSRRTIARLEAAEVADPGVDLARNLAATLGVTLQMLVERRLVVARLPVPEALAEALRSHEGVHLLERMLIATR